MTTDIGLRRLGSTDIEITPIGLGAWQFSKGRGFNGLFWSELPDSVVCDIVRAALEGGINWFDTAEYYGAGRSERALARALQTCEVGVGDVVVATKWWPLLRTAGSIRGTIDERLANLAPFPIDLHQVHNPMSFSSVEAEMDAMADLVEQGKIRAVGVSNFSAEKMRRAQARLAERGLSLASNQVKYSLLSRGVETNGVLDAARDMGITIIAYSPLEMGLLTGKFHEDADRLKRRPLARRLSLSRKIEASRVVIDALREIAAAHNVTPAQVALSWLVSHHGDTVVAIPGASKERQAAENAGAMKIELSGDELALLDERSRRFR